VAAVATEDVPARGGHRRAGDRRVHPHAGARRCLATAGLGGDGPPGPGDLRLPPCAGCLGARRRGVRRGQPGAPRHRQDAGPLADPSVAVERRDGVGDRHRRNRGAARHLDQRCADAGVPGRRQPRLPAAELHDPRGRQPAHRARTIRQPGVVRGVGQPRIPGPQLRRQRPRRRGNRAGERQARTGTDPGLRRAADGRHRRTANRRAAQ